MAQSAAARAERIVVVGSVSIMAIAVLVGAFYVGTRMSRAAAAEPARSTPATSAPATPAASASATPTSRPTPTTQAAPGTRQWTLLAGGECIARFQSPWQPTFDVVACSADHDAQMTLRVELSGDAYPGTDDLVQRLSLACASAKAVDLAKAERYSDLTVSYAYPTQADWAAADRSAFCFAARSSGGAITGSIAGS